MLKRVASISSLFLALHVATVLALSVSGGEYTNITNINGNTTTTTTTTKSIFVQPQHSNSSSSASPSSSFSSSHGGGGGSGSGGSSSSKKHSSKRRGGGGGGGGVPLARFSSFDSDLRWPIGYRYKYASDFDSYVSSSYDFIDVDTDIENAIDLHEPIWFPLHYDVDLDLDLDLDDIDLDLDLLKLKYGLYGLNHYSLHNPRFNDYRFRRRYRSHSRPYLRAHHRYLPQYWKHDLDFWGLDNYGLGFGYDKYLYSTSLSTPTSYSHISTF